jgi:hypothetical protein
VEYSIEDSKTSNCNRNSTKKDKKTQNITTTINMASGLKMFSLENQTAIITGATRGIGQAAALGLAEAGADIILIQVCTVSLLQILE